MKSGPKRQTIKGVDDCYSYQQHRNKEESRFFWKRIRLIEKREIRKEVDDQDK